MLNFWWDGDQVGENMLNSYKRKHLFSYLPLFVMWEVWKARDKAIFSNKFQRVEVILLKIISSFFEWNTDISIGKLTTSDFWLSHLFMMFFPVSVNLPHLYQKVRHSPIKPEHPLLVFLWVDYFFFLLITFGQFRVQQLIHY